MPSGIFIGVMSGLASAVLFLSASRGGLFLQLTLFVLTPLPMMIVGIAFGWRAALASALAGSAIMALTNSRFPFAFFVAFGAPALLAAVLADLGRRDADGKVAWLPPGNILASFALLGGVLPTLLALLNNGSFASLKSPLTKFVRDFSRQMENQLRMPPLTDIQVELLTDRMILWLPGVLSAYWMLLMAINLYLAGRVARTSGLLIRPWPDLHRLMSPPWMMIVLIAGLLLSMTAGLGQVLGVALLGAIWIALLLLGLSVLHAIAAGRIPWMLWLAYAALLNPAGPYAMVLIGFLGLIEPLIGLRERFAKPPVQPTT